MGGFMSELDRRCEAVRLVEEEGLPVAVAAQRVGRSRRWLSKWLRRARAGESLEDRSRVSSTSFTASDDGIEDVVLEYRQGLEDDPVASVGGVAILAAMERDGLTGLPSVRRIERIVTDSGRSRPKTPKPSRSTAPVLPLPKVAPRPGVWQQTDWVQDRYLKGGIRYNSIQLVDHGSKAGLARQYQNRTMLNVVEYLIEHAWRLLSIPDAISTDNAFSKTSHPNNPWTLFVRACLFFGTEPVISPPHELGWTNTVENFNNLWQARTIAKRHYNNLELLAADTDRFNYWANHHRPILEPGIHGTRYPATLISHHNATLRWPPHVFLADHQDTHGRITIPLTTGRVTFLRRVHDKHIHIAHNHWKIDLPNGALVIASITTADATLTLRHHAETHTTYPYPIPHPITDPYYPPQPHSIYHHA